MPASPGDAAAMAAAAAAAAASEAAQKGSGEPEKKLSAKEAAEARRAQRLAERRAAEEELKARRRMLGNIQFIGHLYRYSMLTEGIMHSCIKRLLASEGNPKMEDIECLCKLLTTVGQQLENPPFRAKGDVNQREVRELGRVTRGVCQGCE